MWHRAVVLGRERNDVARLRVFVLVLVAVTMVVLAWSASAHAYRVFVTTNAGAPGAGVGSVTSISTKTDAFDRPALVLGKGATGIAVTPDGRRAYAVNNYESTVSVIDTASNTRATADIDVGGRPGEVKVTPNGRTVYVTNHVDGVVTVIDSATNKVVGPGIPIGSPSLGGGFSIAITPDGTRAYVTNLANNTASVIDTVTNTVIGPDIPLGGKPFDIEVTPDGSRAYVVNAGAGSVSVIDTVTNTVAGLDIPVGRDPDAIAISPDGSRVYVANQRDHDVSVINTLTNTLAGPDIPVGGLPSGLAFTPDGARVYVTNQAGRSVSVIDTATNALAGPDISTKGSSPYGIAIASVPPALAPPPPVVAEKVNVKPVKGEVKTKCRGEKELTRLTSADGISVGCLVDTRKGTVRLTSSKGDSGGTQSAIFSKGLFKVTQRAGKRPYTVLALAGSMGCGKKRRTLGSTWGLASSAWAATDQASVSKKKKRNRGRKLLGKGTGRFMTKGKYGSASVRGTKWLVEDRCNGSSLFKVESGVVKVRDFAKKKTVTVKKGGKYVARARRR